jgi:Metallopeptidase family M24
LIATIIIFPKCYLRLLRADSLFLQRRRLRLCHHAAHGDDDRNTNGSAHKNNWRNFSDRIIQPGDIVFIDLAALTWNGYTSCYYRTYCVGKEGQMGNVHLSPEAQAYFAKKGCKVLLQSTPEAIRVFNEFPKMCFLLLFECLFHEETGISSAVMKVLRR